MTPLIPAAEVAAMDAMAGRWLDEAKTLVLMEEGPFEPADVLLMRQYQKALYCLLVHLDQRGDLPTLFGATGYVLGDLYGQQDMATRAELNAALAEGLTNGIEDAEDADGAVPERVGRA